MLQVTPRPVYEAGRWAFGWQFTSLLAACYFRLLLDLTEGEATGGYNVSQEVKNGVLTAFLNTGLNLLPELYVARIDLIYASDNNVTIPLVAALYLADEQLRRGNPDLNRWRKQAR